MATRFFLDSDQFIYPGLALLLTGGGILTHKYLSDTRLKNRIKQLFQNHLHPQVVEQVMKRPELLQLKGERREMSVIFSDIRGFTSFAEKMAPVDVVQFLNQYFDTMTRVIFDYKGTLDKLIGDAVMCFWGHPIATEDHALRATLCALDMVHAAEELRPLLILPGAAKFEIGIGVSTGPMVVGNMGSQKRVNYTVLGDSVNFGSRLESLNKYYGTRILICDATYAACKDIVFCRQLDTIRVKGKSDGVTIYEPLGMRRVPDDRRTSDRRAKNSPSKKARKTRFTHRHDERRLDERRLGSERIVVRPDQEEVATMYELALTLYRSGDFDGAQMGFDHVLSLSPNDIPSKLMQGRISKYRLEYAGAGPGSTFDPIYNFAD